MNLYAKERNVKEYVKVNVAEIANANGGSF